MWSLPELLDGIIPLRVTITGIIVASWELVFEILDLEIRKGHHYFNPDKIQFNVTLLLRFLQHQAARHRTTGALAIPRALKELCFGPR